MTNIVDSIPQPKKSNGSMSYVQLYTKNTNSKIKRKIKIIKLLTTDHLSLY